MSQSDPDRNAQSSATPEDVQDDLAALRAERDALRQELKRCRAEFSALREHAPIGIATFDREGNYLRVNKWLADLNGLPAEEHLGRSVAEIVPKMSQVAESSIGQVIATGEPIRGERVMGFVNERSERSRVLEVEWYPTFRGDEVETITVLVSDATEAERHELFAKHMIRELQHRVKNSLANVMALVEQALRSNRSKEDVLHVLRERITALAKIHGKLSERNWESIDLTVLVNQEFGHKDRQGQLDIEGPSLEFGPQSSLAMSMALHELAANARRFGALSCPAGRLSIHWNISGTGDDAYLFLRWRETGCSVLEDRGSPGFGSRLIATSVRNALRGELTEHWLDDGLCVEMQLPVSFIGPPKREFPVAGVSSVSRAS